jgi:hypothetical protein
MGQCMGVHTRATGPKNVQAIHDRKRSLHQIERRKTINNLCLMHFTSHVCVYLCLRSIMPSLYVTCVRGTTRLQLEGR